MFNIMLDPKPDSWNGYPVNTDFRIGIQINQAIQDPELMEREKMEEVISLLFPGIVPEGEEIGEAISWYLNGWYLDNKVDSSGNKKHIRDMDWDVDQWRIYSAFRAQYGIDLNTAELHWWEFMGLLNTLEECAFTRVIDIRNKRVTGKMAPEERKAIIKAKQLYSLDRQKKPEAETLADREKENEIVARFMQYAGGGKDG